MNYAGFSISAFFAPFPFAQAENKNKKQHKTKKTGKTTPKFCKSHEISDLAWISESSIMKNEANVKWEYWNRKKRSIYRNVNALEIYLRQLKYEILLIKIK